MHKTLRLTDCIYILGMVPYHVVYTAAMDARRVDGGGVTTFAVSSPGGVQLEHTYTFTQRNAGTFVEDVVTVLLRSRVFTAQVHAPWVLRWYVERTARAAHTHAMEMFPDCYVRARAGSSK